jgi:DNA-binding transcriptional ArsR family regulator
MHPTRSAILRKLEEDSPASVGQIARALNLPASSVSDGMRWLYEQGLVKESHTRKRRGALERLFQPNLTRACVTEEEWNDLRPKEKRQLLAGFIRALVARVRTAVGGHSTKDSIKCCWASSVVDVDAKGWAELTDVHRGALAEVDRIVMASDKRADATPGIRMRVCSTLLLFDLPDR